MANRERLSRPPRILIASDQDHGLRELEGFLGQHGYSVLRVYAGAPVLERARDVRPDVILLDARLADRDSLALGNALRDVRSGPRGRAVSRAAAGGGPDVPRRRAPL